MGLGDLISKVVTVYKADTTDHKRAVKELSGEEKKLAQDRLKATEDHNAGLESQIKTLGKVAAGIGLVYGAVAALKGGYEELREFDRLTTAAGSVNLEKLKTASHGLKSEMQL